MFRIILILTILFIGYSCFTLDTKKKERDVFINEDLNTQIIFDEYNFLIKYNSINNHSPLFTCSDTIAFGKWRRDETSEFIRLQSPDYLIESILDCVLDEKKQLDENKFYFIINNPIESHYKRFSYSPESRELEYILNVKSNRESLINTLNNKLYNTNIIEIPKPDDAILFEIGLTIVTNSKFSARGTTNKEFYTIPYDVKNSSSNYFFIDIPNLSHCKIESKVLNDDFVKIINDSTLEWDGNFYKKKS